MAKAPGKAGAAVIIVGFICIHAVIALLLALSYQWLSPQDLGFAPHVSRSAATTFLLAGGGTVGVATLFAVHPPASPRDRALWVCLLLGPLGMSLHVAHAVFPGVVPAQVGTFGFGLSSFACVTIAVGTFLWTAYQGVWVPMRDTVRGDAP